MRSLGDITMDTCIVNSIRPIRETIPETSLDKILNNFYTDNQNQVEIVTKIYLMLQDADNKTRTTPLPSVPNYSEVENRKIVIKYFLNLMDGLINTNWVIDTQRIPGGPLKETFFNLTYTESYTLLNKLVDFYDNNKNILKTDLDNSKM